METSILNTVKKLLGIDVSYTAFDLDVITHVNSAFSVLTQLGVGPTNGFMITDEVLTWDDLGLDVDILGLVRTYVCLKTRSLFDPPTTSFALDAMDKQLKEYEWRISTYRETTDSDWPPPVGDTDYIFDGGTP